MMDGDEHALRIETQLTHQQVPGEPERVPLEVVAEREVAEHLEERVMPGRLADLLQVVVFAAGAHAFLRRGRALEVDLLLTEKDTLELDHPGIGEQQRGIVGRDQRRAGPDRVPALAEEIEEALADVVCLHRRDLSGAERRGGLKLIARRSSPYAREISLMGSRGRKTQRGVGLRAGPARRCGRVRSQSKVAPRSYSAVPVSSTPGSSSTVRIWA